MHEITRTVFSRRSLSATESGCAGLIAIPATASPKRLRLASLRRWHIARTTADLADDSLDLDLAFELLDGFINVRLADGDVDVLHSHAAISAGEEESGAGQA